MKKFLVLILSVIAAFAAAISLTACEAKVDKDGNVTITDGDKSNDDNNGGSGSGSGNGSGSGTGGEQGNETPEHSHTYNKQVATEPYLKSAASCTARAVYYYSCECGEKGEQTFEYGDKLPHTYDKQVATEPYLKSAASCTARAVYYYSCECGAASEIKTFEYGDKLPHTYDKQVATETYLKSVATCTRKAAYYYSCKCGLASDSETFEYGEILPHEFNNAYICTNCSYKCKSDGLSFELSTDNSSYVCTGLGTFNGKILIIPAEYDGKPVTKIEDDAFKNSTDITDVFIPDSVTEVGFNAFGGCSNLSKMVLPFVGAYADGGGDENIGYIFGADGYERQGRKLPSALKTVVLSDITTKIGDYSFYGCSSLTSITIPDSVTSIGGGAFRDCSSLTSITIPDGMISVGDYAFYGCGSLKNIIIPNSVTGIGKYAFYNSSSLTSITIPDRVTSIGKGAFLNCRSLTSINVNPNNKNYKAIDGNLYSKDGETLILYAMGKTDKSFEIPDSVTSIGDYALYGCSSLTSVTIGNSVTGIGNSAFEGCSSLQFNRYDNGLYLGNETNKYLALIKPKRQGVKNITINDECKIITGGAFSDCSSLTSVTIGNSVTSIGERAFAFCSSLYKIYYNGTVNDWVQIDGLGYLMSNVSSLYINGELLTEVVIDTANEIKSCAFFACSKLTSITISDSVTSIGDCAFAWCTSLTSIIIPDSVTSIGRSVFSNSESHKTINYKGSKEQWESISKGDGCDYGTGSYTINYNYVEE